MAPASTTNDSLFTLQYGTVPPELLEEGHQPPDTSQGTVGWWVTGLSYDQIDDELLYVVGEPSMAGAAVAQRHFAGLVGTVATRLADGNHDIQVLAWHRLAGRRFEPELVHSRNTMTIRTVDGRVREFEGLSYRVPVAVIEAVEQFDAGLDPNDEGPFGKQRASTVCLDAPIRKPLVEGAFEVPRASLVTIRIASIVEVQQDRYVDPVTREDLAAWQAKHAAEQAKRRAKRTS